MKRLYLGLVRRPHVQRFDRVADGHISVHTHHRQGEGAGEHVVVVDRHHRFAQSVPKRPKTQEHVGALKKKHENTRMKREMQLQEKHKPRSPQEYESGR